MFMRLLLLVLLLLPMSCVVADTSDAPESAPAIVVVGDSLSAAYGMQMTESWPSLLQQRLSAEGFPHQVVNSSITGETTQGGRSRLPRLLSRHHPELVIIELGGNDGLRGLPLEVTRGNLSAMIEASQDSGAQVMLFEMRIPPNYGAAYTKKFHQSYAELAEKYDVTLQPFILENIALEPGMMQADGIHPTAQAQPVILDQVWSVLESLLRSTVTSSASG